MTGTTISYAMTIRETMLMISFPICVFGLLMMVYRGVQSGETKYIFAIIFTFVVIGTVAVYPQAVLAAADMIRDESSEISNKVDQGLEEWSKSRIAGEDSTWNFQAKITSAFYKASFALSTIVRQFLAFIQRLALYFLIAVSPLMLSFFLIRETSDLAVKFIMTSFGIILWSIGFNLSDMMLFSGWDIIMRSTISSSGVFSVLEGFGISAGQLAGTTMSAALPFVSIGLAFSIAFYFMIGVLFFNILGVIMVMTLLHGGNPISSAMGTAISSTMFANTGMNAAKAAMSGAKNLGGGMMGGSIAGGIAKVAKAHGTSAAAKGLSTIDSNKKM